MIDLFLGFGVIVAYIYNIYISFGIVNIPYIREPLRPETLEPFLVHQANHFSVSYNPEPNMVDGADGRLLREVCAPSYTMGRVFRASETLGF